MIIKLMTRTTRGSIRSLAKYVLNYTSDAIANNEKQAKVLLSHNLPYRNNMESYINAFTENEATRIYRRKNSTILQHVVISFSPADHAKVSDDILRKVSKKWIDLTASDCLCLVVVHEKMNRHVHLVISGVKTDGRSATLTKRQFVHVLDEMERYQDKEFPMLTLSANNHEKKYRHLHEMASIQSKKIFIIERMKEHLMRAGSYVSFVKNMPFSAYYRAGRLQGILYEGKKYRLSTLGITKQDLLELDIRGIRSMNNTSANDQTHTELNVFERLRNRKRGRGISPALQSERDFSR